MRLTILACLALTFVCAGCAPTTLVAPFVAITHGEKGGTIESIHGYQPEAIRDAIEAHCARYGRVPLVKYRDNFNDSLTYECL